MIKTFIYIIFLTSILISQKILFPYKTKLEDFKNDLTLEVNIENIPQEIKTKFIKSGINSDKKYIFKIQGKNIIEIIPISSGARKNISMKNILSLLKVNKISQISDNKFIFKETNSGNNKFYSCIDNKIVINGKDFKRRDNIIKPTNKNLLSSIYKLKPSVTYSCLLINTNNLKNIEEANNLKKYFTY